MSYYNRHVFVCVNQKAAGKTCCANTGGEQFFDYLKLKLLEMGQHGVGKVRVSKSGCLGRCASGPCIVIYPDEVWYSYQSMADIDEIVEEHLINNRVVQHLILENQVAE